MTPAPCARLGPHQIVASLGADGMDEVCRATHSKLGRDMAVRALPGHPSVRLEVRPL